ncbi:hypothetical protein [Spirosoma oryzicola]|uniref:hypothetical protein n=1 Tax=Spirosoma oryzicola TaxID=2898794 RepID=UPI001E315D5D|nr:hypothetical protein [Spirosoma oryzicola]UHG92958.1 hypothetical protein LQ777_08655 [Spirosoma oryzicola]
MKKQPSKKVLSINELSPDKVLARWLAEVSTLQQQYSLLNNYIAGTGELPQDPSAAGYVGQCTLRQLMSLCERLHSELADLLQDMKEPDQLSAQQKFNKLAMHTLQLEELNQHTQLMLHLAELPAS